MLHYVKCHSQDIYVENFDLEIILHIIMKFMFSEMMAAFINKIGIKMGRRCFWRCFVCIRNVLIFLIIFALITMHIIKSFQHEEISNIIRSSRMEHLFVPINDTNRKLNISEIESIVLERNKQQPILNEEVYGAIKQDTVIMVITVHRSSINLRFTILSLSQVKGIQESLIVFSHSCYDENVNDLIKTIDFCRVLQIFYPHSLELHPNRFPGFTPGDCTYEHSLEEAESLNCTGVASPDIHGRFRNPAYAQKKHFWWWTANQVFDELKTVENHNGIVVFIEDYYIFMEDFLYMTLFMKNVASAMPGCEFLSLASSVLPSNNDEATVEVKTWDPNLHSGVLAFDLSVWNSIVSHYDRFCEIDDYSWAESLIYVSLNRIDGNRYRVMSSKFPRAYKSDTCMYFGTLTECDVHTSVQQIYNLQDQKSKFLFPTYLQVFVDIEFEDRFISLDYVDINGGWNDPRDKAFCRNLTLFKIKKEIMRMNHQFDDIQ